MGWAGLNPVVGRAAQAWPHLFSGSWGSSSTNPLTLYLFGGILEILSLDFKSAHIAHYHNYVHNQHHNQYLVTIIIIHQYSCSFIIVKIILHHQYRCSHDDDLPIYPPCYKVVTISSRISSSNQDNGVSSIRNPTCSRSTMF